MIYYHILISKHIHLTGLQSCPMDTTDPEESFAEQFLEYYCTPNVGVATSGHDIFNAYISHCTIGRRSPISPGQFARVLKHSGIPCEPNEMGDLVWDVMIPEE